MLSANRVSLSPEEFPDEVTIWVGPRGIRAVRGRDAAGGLRFIDLSDCRYPGFAGYPGSGFFLHQCKLTFDHEELALPQDLIRAGNLVISNGAASLVVREGKFDHLTFVGLTGKPFDDSLHDRVRNAVVANSWQICVEESHGPIVLHRSK